MSDKKKRIIQFDMWINDGRTRYNNFWGTNEIGYPESKTIEFETDGKELMQDAFDALRYTMQNADYSISYWTWID